jgi:DNA repair exonuclease SbcCD ATPase subunit
MSETTTAITLPDPKLLVQFGVADGTIAELSEQYMPLRVEGLSDSKGLAAVHAARMHVKGLRVDVEKKRKQLKADAIEYGRIVDGEAKRITALLAPIEDHLQSQEQIVLDEKARLKREEEERRAAALQARMDQLAEVGSYPAGTVIESMTEERFLQFLGESRAQHEARKREEAAEAERQRAEREKLEAEQRRLEEERRKLDAERAEIEAEKRRVEEAGQARLAAEARARAEEAERQRQEALRPDLERLRGVAVQLRRLKVPSVSAGADDARAEVLDAIAVAARRVEEICFVEGAS